MNKQFYVLEMNNFTEDEAMEFLNNALHDAKWGKNQGMTMSHLTEKGVQDLKQHVFKQVPTSEDISQAIKESDDNESW